MKNHMLFWAKAKGDENLRHLLLCHMIDVAMVVRVLWAETLQDSFLMKMTRSLNLDNESTGAWIAFWAGLHDIGKASPGFQERSQGGRAGLEQAGLSFKRIRKSVHHGILTAKILPPMLTQIGLSSSLAHRLSVAVAGHHGRYPSAEQYFNLGNMQLGDAQWYGARNALFEEFYNVLGIDRLPVPEAVLDDDHAATMLLSGLVSVSDWIGSIEQHFPYQAERIDPKEYACLAKTRAMKALERIHWHKCNAASSSSFAQMFGFSPNQIQSKVLSLSEQIEGPSLVILEAPMGVGKTESALWLRDVLSRQGFVGCYVALPTEATSNQMFARVREHLEERYPNERINLQMVHGHASLSPDFRELRLSSIFDGESRDAAVVAEEWFTPKKRALLAPYAVGTLDQALLGVLSVKHGFVRLFGLGGKTVIIDEVHAYDTYTSTLLDRLLEWLAAVGASVILLSATLPKERCSKLINAFAGEKIDLPEVPYPRVTLVQKGRTLAEHLPLGESREIVLSVVKGEVAEIADKLLKTIKNGGCAAWVCNTVGRAQEVYSSIKAILQKHPQKEVLLDLFHARFPYGQRQLREKGVLDKYGKGLHSRPSRGIVVATQVIEQSLDLDFDLMISDAAPVDLVLQRAGRLHRHIRKHRPVNVSRPTFWLVEPVIRDKQPDFGSDVYVYDEYLLLRSWAFLKVIKTLTLPGDIDSLVQQVYDPCAKVPQGTPSSWLDRMVKARERAKQKAEEDEREGLVRAIKSPSYPDDILEAFDCDLEEENPSVHRAFQALTRLGESVEVVCLHSSDGQIFSDRECTRPVDLQKRPDGLLLEELMSCSVRLSHRGLMRYLQSKEEGAERPPSWRRSAYLRNHYCLLFQEGRCNLDHWVLELDPDLGLLVNKQEEHSCNESR